MGQANSRQEPCRPHRTTGARAEDIALRHANGERFLAAGRHQLFEDFVLLPLREQLYFVAQSIEYLKQLGEPLALEVEVEERLEALDAIDQTLGHLDTTIDALSP